MVCTEITVTVFKIPLSLLVKARGEVLTDGHPLSAEGTGRD
jgi:hypothetical protein